MHHEIDCAADEAKIFMPEEMMADDVLDELESRHPLEECKK